MKTLYKYIPFLPYLPVRTILAWVGGLFLSENRRVSEKAAFAIYQDKAARSFLPPLPEREIAVVRRAPRAVLDNNVMLSGLFFHSGALSRLRSAWQSNATRPVVSRGAMEELIRVLAYPKFRLTNDEREALLGDYLPCIQCV